MTSLNTNVEVCMLVSLLSGRGRGLLLAAIGLALLLPLASRADKATDQNKAIARRYLEEIVNQGKFAVADEIIAADYVYHGRGPEGKGPAIVKEFVGMYRTAFPDLHLAVEDVFAEGDRVAVRVSATGTHSGPLMDVAPTGKKVQVTSIGILRLANGKVAEEWEVIDEIEMMRQLGLIPAE